MSAVPLKARHLGVGWNAAWPVERSHVLGPFRHCASYLSRSSANGSFTLGRFAAASGGEDLKRVYAAKQWFHSMLSLINMLSEHRTGGIETPSILKDVVFRYIPNEGFTTKDILVRLDPDDPMDFDFSCVWGYEIYIVLNDIQEHNPGQPLTTAQFVAQRYIQFFPDNFQHCHLCRPVKTFAADGSEQVCDDEGETMKKKAAMRTVSQAERARKADILRSLLKMQNGEVLPASSPFHLQVGGSAP